VALETRVGLESLCQPEQKILIALALFSSRVKHSADQGVCLILNAKHKVSTGLAVNAGGIGEGGKILAEQLRLVMAGLEFQPFRFHRFSEETPQQSP
jgi:hypothetical protein